MKCESSTITTHEPWNAIGTTWTSAITTPAVGGRKYGTVKGTSGIHVIEPDQRHNVLQFRFLGSSNNDSLVFDIIAARGPTDYFTKVATATCTVGQMQKGSATILYCDTIVLSAINWPSAMIVAASPANDHAASVWLDRLGWHSWAVVPTTVNGTARAEYSGC